MNEGANDGRKDALLYKRVRLLRRRIHVINVVAGSVAHRARSPDLDEDLPNMAWFQKHAANMAAKICQPKIPPKTGLLYPMPDTLVAFWLLNLGCHFSRKSITFGRQNN